MNELDIANLLCSRICHDLVSPVGAITNGLEVLEDDNDPEMRVHALSLIGSSAESASAKLKYMRIAFGAAATLGDAFSAQEVGTLVETLVKGGRLSIDWSAVTGTLAKDETKLLLNLVLLGIEALPRGGIIAAHHSDRALGITCTGTNAALPEIMIDILEGKPGAVPDHRSVVAYVVRKLVHQAGSALTHQKTGETVSLEVIRE